MSGSRPSRKRAVKEGIKNALSERMCQGQDWSWVFLRGFKGHPSQELNGTENRSGDRWKLKSQSLEQEAGKLPIEVGHT